MCGTFKSPHGIAQPRDASGRPSSWAQSDTFADLLGEALQALLAATSDDPLKVLCNFSSVAARCGNQGQVAYAMANEALNKLAQAERIRRPDAVVKSLGWGPWKGGMVGPELDGVRTNEKHEQSSSSLEPSASTDGYVALRCGYGV